MQNKQKMWRLNNIRLDDKRITKEIKDEIKKYV